MSRVAKKPIALPKGVECQIGADAVTVKGPKGTLSMHALPGVKVALAHPPNARTPVFLTG